VPRLAFPLLLLGLAGCAAKPEAPPAAAEHAAYSEEGEASWYGSAHQGKMTAAGEPYDMRKMTAAHRTLPFGTMVRVTNLDNGRMVTVRINDRGPFVRGRIIDLSAAAARGLDMKEDGVARVRLETFAADQSR
jgi:rare lipoprotein A